MSKTGDTVPNDVLDVGQLKKCSVIILSRQVYEYNHYQIMIRFNIIRESLHTENLLEFYRLAYN